VEKGVYIGVPFYLGKEVPLRIKALPVASLRREWPVVPPAGQRVMGLALLPGRPVDPAPARPPSGTAAVFRRAVMFLDLAAPCPVAWYWVAVWCFFGLNCGWEQQPRSALEIGC